MSSSASKSALHSLIWSLRSQLAYAPTTSHIRVVEVLPPAVQTELHDLQPELVAAGKHVIGIPLADYLDDAWESLDQWDAQEAEVFARGDKARAYEHINDARKEVFVNFAACFSTAALVLTQCENHVTSNTSLLFIQRHALNCLAIYGFVTLGQEKGELKRPPGHATPPRTPSQSGGGCCLASHLSSCPLAVFLSMKILCVLFVGNHNITTTTVIHHP